MDLLPRWNPLRKKSGLMSVMHAQTKKGRVVSKHGRINTFRRKEEVRHDKHRSSDETYYETIFALFYRYLKDFFTSMIELSWSWTLFSFAASFFISWLGFAVAWYLFLLAFVADVYPCKVLSPHSPCFQTRYIVVLTHGDLRDDLEDDHVVCIRIDLLL